MASAESLGKLRDLMLYYYRAGARGFLISGGFNARGFLPISREHVDLLKEFKKERQVFLSVHLGLAPREVVDEALEVFDLVDYEVPPSIEYVRYGRGLNASLEDYLRTLEYITEEYGEDRVAPHVVVNSSLALTHEELEVVKKLSSVYRGIVVLLLHISSEKLEEERILAVARLSKNLFREVSLGCMRPRKQTKLIDELIGRGYLDRVVNPGRIVTEKYGMRIINACCSIPRHVLELFEQNRGAPTFNRGL